MSRPDTRPTWFLGPNAIPVLGSRKTIPDGATHTCREGDARWTPLPGQLEAERDWIGRDFSTGWEIVSWGDFARWTPESGEPTAPECRQASQDAPGRDPGDPDGKPDA